MDGPHCGHCTVAGTCNLFILSVLIMYRGFKQTKWATVMPADGSTYWWSHIGLQYLSFFSPPRVAAHPQAALQSSTTFHRVLHSIHVKSRVTALVCEGSSSPVRTRIVFVSKWLQVEMKSSLTTAILASVKHIQVTQIEKRTWNLIKDNFTIV